VVCSAQVGVRPCTTLWGVHLQSLLGRKVLERQLVRLGVLKAGETVKSHEAFNTAYKIGELSAPGLL